MGFTAQAQPCWRTGARGLVSTQAQAAEEAQVARRPATSPDAIPAGEDAAVFDPAKQSTGKWVFFTVELAVVLAALYAVRPLSPYKCMWHVQTTYLACLHGGLHQAC